MFKFNEFYTLTIDAIIMKVLLYTAFISFQIILNAPQDIALKAIEILKEIYTNLGSDLKTKQVRKVNSLV